MSDQRVIILSFDHATGKCSYVEVRNVLDDALDADVMSAVAKILAADGTADAAPFPANSSDRLTVSMKTEAIEFELLPMPTTRDAIITEENTRVAGSTALGAMNSTALYVASTYSRFALLTGKAGAFSPLKPVTSHHAGQKFAYMMIKASLAATMTAMSIPAPTMPLYALGAWDEPLNIISLSATQTITDLTPGAERYGRWKQIEITGSSGPAARTAYYKVVGTKLFYLEPAAKADLETDNVVPIPETDGAFVVPMAKDLGSSVILDSVTLTLSAGVAATVASAYDGGAAASETFVAQGEQLVKPGGVFSMVANDFLVYNINNFVVSRKMMTGVSIQGGGTHMLELLPVDAMVAHKRRADPTYAEPDTSLTGATQMTAVAKADFDLTGKFEAASLNAMITPNLGAMSVAGGAAQDDPELANGYILQFGYAGFARFLFKTATPTTAADLKSQYWQGAAWQDGYPIVDLETLTGLKLA